MRATPGPAGGKGTGYGCLLRGPSSEASEVGPFAITWQVLGLISW